MTKLIEFLEKMGGDAQMRTASGEDLVHAMELAGIDAAAREILANQDQRGLEELMGASANVFCSLETPDDGGEDEGTPPPDSDAPTVRVPRKKKSSKKKGSKKKRGGKKAPRKPAPKRAPKKGSKKKAAKKKGGKKKKTSRKKK
ncbi:MAG TPA: hypothetical protein PKE27_11725 [Povalibacter sp.]|uniref:hypothetical protein n=1 Tax=Povalibacter sp. TaxID=1962978 RepID=UPI002C3CBA90|nr:hypothetical protein [Povalibacter sp.]HMN45240.1 hypothetical protein [Povalibacter sp.]